MRILFFALSWFLLSTSTQLSAVQHSYVNYMRSSNYSYIFVSQAIGGEYGEITSRSKPSAVTDIANAADYESRTSNWKGSDLKTSAGLELINFFQLEAGHTFINLKHQNDGYESLSGSRFNVGAKLVFRSPVINLEGGAGVLASRIDYQNGYAASDLYGSGSYYSLSANYFLHSQVSVFCYGKNNSEHYVRNSGSYLVNEMDTKTTSMGLGFSLWL